MKVPGKLTNSEKIAIYAQWQQLKASSGAYEIKGTTAGREDDDATRLTLE